MYNDICPRVTFLVTKIESVDYEDFYLVDKQKRRLCTLASHEVIFDQEIDDELGSKNRVGFPPPRRHFTPSSLCQKRF